jgi:hypothetical protein
MTGIPQIRRDAGSVDGRKPASNEDEKRLEFPCIMRYTVQAENPRFGRQDSRFSMKKPHLAAEKPQKRKKTKKSCTFVKLFLAIAKMVVYHISVRAVKAVSLRAQG